MELLDNKIKEYVASISVPDVIKPSQIKQFLVDDGKITAYKFLKQLREMKMSGSEFIELLSKTCISNADLKRIEENPHMQYEELLQILNKSALQDEDYRSALRTASLMNRGETEETAEDGGEETPSQDSGNTAIKETDERSASEEMRTTAESAPEKAEDDKAAEARSIIEQIQKSIENRTENGENALADAHRIVESYENYTDSNIEYEETLQLETPELIDASVHTADIPELPEYDETDECDGFEDDGDEIEPSVKELGDALTDLVENGEPPVSKKSKGCLIAAFICAFLLFACAGALKILRYYDIIPNYIFKIPEIIRQNIVDFPTLLEEVILTEQKVGYELPEAFVTNGGNGFAASKNAVGKEVCVAVTMSEGEYHLTGAMLDNGEIGESFSFALNMNDIYVQYHNGIFVVTGSLGDMTETRFYDEGTISSGNYIYSYKQSGKCIGYYTDSNAFYLVTENSFNLLDADNTRLTSFVPCFEIDGELSVVPFDKIIMPEIAAKLHYCTVSRLPFDMSGENIKTVLMGDAGGYRISASGLFTCDNVYLNESYRTRVCKIAFDKDLTSYRTDVDGALNPKMLMDGKDCLLAVGLVKEADEFKNAVFKFDLTLSGTPAVLSPIADKCIIEKAICGDEVLTLIATGEKTMQYNVKISDLSAAEKGSVAGSEKKFSDSLSASVSVSFNEDGMRTGIVLTVNDKDKTASVTASIKDGVYCEWDEYLDSSMISDISQLPYYISADEVIIGLPITFFDGVSEVWEYRFYKYKSGALSEIGRISLYDKEISTVYCGFTSGEKPYVLTLWDNKVITADIENIKIISESEITALTSQEQAEQQ